MKTLKFALIFTVIVFYTCDNVLVGQTVQLYPNITVTNGMIYCLERPLSGYVIYHLTYHIDKKTGFVDRMHGNIHEAELYDSEGVKYMLHDTGNYNIGVSWSFWNETTMGGTNTFIYDQGSYKVPKGTLPMKGGSVWSTTWSLTSKLQKPSGKQKKYGNPIKIRLI